MRSPCGCRVCSLKNKIFENLERLGIKAHGITFDDTDLTRGYEPALSKLEKHLAADLSKAVSDGITSAKAAKSVADAFPGLDLLMEDKLFNTGPLIEKVPGTATEAAAIERERAKFGYRHDHWWSCKIGPFTGLLPSGSDAPLRRAVKEAFLSVTGIHDKQCESGWGKLDRKKRPCTICGMIHGQSGIEKEMYQSQYQNRILKQYGDCKSCKWFKEGTGPSLGKVGRCQRRSPPLAYFPEVFIDDSCGDFERKA